MGDVAVRRPVKIRLCFFCLCTVFLYLVKLAAGAEAKDEQVSVRVSGCKVLPIRTTLAVKQRSVALALNL